MIGGYSRSLEETSATFVQSWPNLVGRGEPKGDLYATISPVSVTTRADDLRPKCGFARHIESSGLREPQPPPDAWPSRSWLGRGFGTCGKQATDQSQRSTDFFTEVENPTSWLDDGPSTTTTLNARSW